MHKLYSNRIIYVDSFIKHRNRLKYFNSRCGLFAIEDKDIYTLYSMRIGVYDQIK